MKKCMLFTLCVVLLCGATLPCHAAQVPEIPVAPMWDNISQITENINFYDGTATATVTAKKSSGCEKIEATLTVYEYVDEDWSYVDSAYKETTATTLAIALPFDTVSGREYKAVAVVISYRDGVGEEVEKTIYKTCP